MAAQKDLQSVMNKWIPESKSIMDRLERMELDRLTYLKMHLLEYANITLATKEQSDSSVLRLLSKVEAIQPELVLSEFCESNSNATGTRNVNNSNGNDDAVVENNPEQESSHVRLTLLLCKTKCVGKWTG